MAIAVHKPKRYDEPKTLLDVSGSTTPPQSFQYLSEPPARAGGVAHPEI